MKLKERRSHIKHVYSTIDVDITSMGAALTGNRPARFMPGESGMGHKKIGFVPNSLPENK